MFTENDKLNLFTFASAVYSFKLYDASCTDITKMNCLTLADFTTKVLPKLPERLRNVLTETVVPTYEEIEKAS